MLDLRIVANSWKHPGCPPDTRIYTFWDYFRKHWERDAGLRIDHLLLNPAVAPRLRDAGVDRWVRGLEKASDHAPTWITLGPLSTKVKPGTPDKALPGPSRREPAKDADPGAPATSRRRSTRDDTPAAHPVRRRRTAVPA